MKKLIYFFLFFTASICSYAQPWMHEIKKNKRGTLNFYDIQTAFDTYWKDKEVTRSKGWKPYKRWEAFMEPRLYPSGKMNTIKLWEEISRANKAEESSSRGRWEQIGPMVVPKWVGNPNDYIGVGRINCVAFHPKEENTFWIGTPSGGLWKTVDGGQNWLSLGDYLPVAGITDIVVDAENTDLMYIATGDSDGVDTYSMGILKTLDGGKTWQPTGFNYNQDERLLIRKFIAMPGNTQMLFVASSDGLFKSEDGGESWTKKEDGNFYDIELKSASTTVMYAGGIVSGNSGIFVSVDGGETFEERSFEGASEPGRMDIEVSTSDKNIAYALLTSVASEFHSIYKTSDSGNSWTKVAQQEELNIMGWTIDGSDAGGQAWYNLAFAVDPKNSNTLYVGGINIWKSTNGGSSWKPASYMASNASVPTVHADHHELIYHPQTGELFNANDGGLNVFREGKWAFLTANINILQAYRLGVAQDGKYIVTGSQDNGVMMKRGDEWFSILSGDGMESIIDPLDKNIIYTENYYGAIQKSIDGGRTFKSIRPVNSPGAWVTPFLMSPGNRQHLYAAYRTVFRTMNGGESWEKIVAEFSPENISSLTISNMDENILYAASRNRIWALYLDDRFRTLREYNVPSFMNLVITDIETSYTNRNELWITLSGYEEDNKIYHTTDGGGRWENYSDGLPNVPVNCIVSEAGDELSLFVGTDIGVYYRNANMDKWENYNKGMPRLVINEIEISDTDNGNELYAATYGRGIWKSPTLPFADFACDSEEVIVGGIVEIEDLSIDEIDEYYWDFGEGATPQTANTKGPHKVTYATEGVKQVSLNVTYAGRSSSIKKEVVEVIANHQLDVFPNPACDVLKVRLASTSRTAVEVELYTADGRLVHKSSREKTLDLMEFEINLSAKYSGNMLLKIRDGEKVFVEKVVVLEKGK